MVTSVQIFRELWQDSTMQMSTLFSMFLSVASSLSGVVTYQETGARLAGVTVTATSPSLQGTRSTITDASGEYTLESLPPGEYRVTFSLGQLAPMTKLATLQLAQRTRLDGVVRAGFNHEIVVHAETIPTVETPQIATNFKLAEIDRLPVQRNQLQTAQMAVGVTANVLANGELAISGGPGYDNLTLVDGVVVHENVRGQIRPMYV